MASVVANRSKQMERLTMCPICLDKFRIPKVLPCMHTFCLTPCLTSLVDPRARSFRCPECRREHHIPPGGIQAFPANLTMAGVLDLPLTTTTTTINLPDRCFICKQQKQTLIKCHDCSQFLCTDCREPHLREAFYNISLTVGQLRRTLPRISEKIAAHEQRINSVRTNYDQIRREITMNTATLIDELKRRETTLLTEAEVYLQSPLRSFRHQQDTADVDLASVASFCESVGALNPNVQLINDADLANMRAQCNLYAQQIDALQAQVPPNVQKLRVTFENQPAVSSFIQNFGQLTDGSQRRQQQQQQPQFSMGAHPQTAARYVSTSQNSRNSPGQFQYDQYRQLENTTNARGSTTAQRPSLSQTNFYPPTQNNAFGSVDDSNFDLNLTAPARTNAASHTAPWDSQTVRRANNSQVGQRTRSGPTAPEASSRRNYVTSMTAARSLEGDDRPIFGGSGGAGRGKGRLPAIASIPEHEPLTNSLQRRGTFVLDEPTLPNLPQSGAQRPRDTVNVPELYNVRRRKRARTPVAFTVNLNEPSQSRASGEIENSTI